MPAPLREAQPCKLGELTGADETSKIEVWSHPASGESALELVEYSWGSGIGWYARKRLSLDSAQAEALRSILSHTRPAAPRRPAPRCVRESGRIRLLLPE